MLSAPLPAVAEESDSISAAPAAGAEPDANRTRFSYQLEPGQSVDDAYFVRNSGTTVQEITVFATDAVTDVDGGFGMRATGDTPVDAGSWVRFADDASSVVLSLGPGESRVLPFSLTVPADARPGDHAGGVVASATTPGEQVSLERRVATRLYARVGGELQPAMTISSVAASYQPTLNPFSGTATVTYTVTNTGNVSLIPVTVVSVRGLFGIPMSSFERAELSEMLPGDVRTLSVSLDGVGQWVFLNPVIDLATSVDADAPSPGVLPKAQRDTVLFVVPWALLVVLAVAGIVWLIIRQRRNRNDARAREWAAHIEAVAEERARAGAAAESSLSVSPSDPTGTVTS